MTGPDSFTDLTLSGDYVPAAIIERHLQVAIRQPAMRPDLYAALLSAKVYVIGAEPVLADEGPDVILPVREGADGPVLHLYTGRSRVPAGTRDEDLTAMPFPMAIADLGEVAVVLDGGSVCELRLPPSHVALLREMSRGQAA